MISRIDWNGLFGHRIEFRKLKTSMFHVFLIGQWRMTSSYLHLDDVVLHELPYHALIIIPATNSQFPIQWTKVLGADSYVAMSSKSHTLQPFFIYPLEKSSEHHIVNIAWDKRCLDISFQSQLDIVLANNDSRY